MNDAQRELIDELNGTLCQCGGGKARKQTFCRKCYFGLPKLMRQALYRRIGSGYEAAYADAITKIEGPP